MDGAVPPIEIIPAMSQDSQEMVQWPTILVPPLPPLLTPPSVNEAMEATMATALAAAPAVTVASMASAVTSIASPHPSPPHTQVRRSPQLLSPGPSIMPSMTPHLNQPAPLPFPSAVVPIPSRSYTWSSWTTFQKYHSSAKFEEKSGNF